MPVEQITGYATTISASRNVGQIVTDEVRSDDDHEAGAGGGDLPHAGGEGGQAHQL